MRNVILCAAMLLFICEIYALGANEPATADETLPLNYVPSGKVMFQQYCATCHGTDAKGNGPLAPLLKTPPANLTGLSKRHAGQFPYEYVSSVLQFGPGPSGHGSSDMPAWGPIFRYYHKQNERAVQQRIKNLSNYLASVQDE
jgi:mono/diheme cytochrome c family protein